MAGYHGHAFCAHAVKGRHRRVGGAAAAQHIAGLVCRVDAVALQHGDKARHVGVVAHGDGAGDHGVHRADGLGGGVSFVQEGNHIPLVGNGHVEAVQGGQQIRHLVGQAVAGNFNQPVVGGDAQAAENGLMNGYGQAVPQLFANQRVVLHQQNVLLEISISIIQPRGRIVHRGCVNAYAVVSGSNATGGPTRRTL